MCRAVTCKTCSKPTWSGYDHAKGTSPSLLGRIFGGRP